MSIVDWFSNDLNTEERTLTRDLLSVAIADQEFSEKELKAILQICQLEDISLVGLMDSIRDKTVGAKVLHSVDEKKKYLLHLIRMMSVDGKYPSLELHIIEIVAKKIGISRVQILSFVLDEIKDNNIGQEEGISIIDHFIKHYLVIGLSE